MIQLRRVWLQPPLAFARLGPSETPCDNYRWGPNDDRPNGTGKTTIQPERTLRLDPATGRVRAHTPARIQFKDAAGFRPVCPFFELHADWEEAGAGGRSRETPVTRDILERAGIAVEDVRWSVAVANLKPFHYTGHEGDRIVATAALRGSEVHRRELQGRSPASRRPLVPDGRYLPMGWVQLAAMDRTFPECRLRFTPPGGFVYGPTDFNERVAAIVARKLNSFWNLAKKRRRPFRLPPERLVLNPDAEWPRFQDPGNPFRTDPARLFLFDDTRDGPPFASMGLVDDVSDGIITCSVGGLTAAARVVVTPPDFAPDRRPFVSIADGLMDRVERRNTGRAARAASTAREIGDLLERILETQGLMNLDVANERAKDLNRGHAENLGLDAEALADRMLEVPPALSGHKLPLTMMARQRHRRLLALEVLEDRLREDPTLIERMVRAPLSPERHHDTKMPIGMQGSDGHPLHLTQRQYDLLVGWARRLRRHVKDV